MQLPWLDADSPFPPTSRALGEHSEAPGLLAAGGGLGLLRLEAAYRRGIFPWYAPGQPVLWWSPDPRMVLPVAEFHLRRSLRQVLARFTRNPRCEVRIDSAFSLVIAACANTPRRGQPGTWILPAMVEAYTALHQAGHAHSIETWVDGQLVGGLYCVAIGKAVFGESMFSRVPDASKIALAALVAFCREHGIALIDCQQNTAHLASLGAHEVPRKAFLEHIGLAQLLPSVKWHFSPLYWNQILSA